jgi:prepilin-type N-terminal cleavage/methylation domain-containing protein
MKRRANELRAGPSPQSSGSAGFTLLELLLSLLLTGIFAAGVQQLCLSLLRSVELLETTSRLQEAARITLTIISRDLRDAGYGLAADTPGVRQASRDSIRIGRDLNTDGDTDDAHEQVAYWFDSDGNRLLRQQGNAPPQPMLDDLAADGLLFTYYDSTGKPISSLNPLTAEDRAALHRVDIQLTLEPPRGGGFAPRPPRVSRTTTVALRND